MTLKTLVTKKFFEEKKSRKLREKKSREKKH